MACKNETLRRLRLGDLRTLFRARWGPLLPDNDAGRSDLHDLLSIISLGANAEIKMAHAVEIWAPWMPSSEAQEVIDNINRMPLPDRRLTNVELGKRHMVTNEQRERLGLRQIWPVDMTVEQMTEHRRGRARMRQRLRRRAAGVRHRVQYESRSINRAKPWLAEGVSRATWYLRRKTSLKLELASWPISEITQDIGGWGWLSDPSSSAFPEGLLLTLRQV